MNPDPLDRKLAAYARQTLPSAPGDVTAGVWREIARRRHQTFAIPIGWTELLAHPAWAVAGLAFALAVGAAPAVVFAKTQQAKRLAQQSLHFEVFSTQTAGQMANVLAPPQSSQTENHFQ